jgi:hypothetical protein
MSTFGKVIQCPIQAADPHEGTFGRKAEQVQRKFCAMSFVATQLTRSSVRSTTDVIKRSPDWRT